MVKVVYNASNTGLRMSEKCLDKYMLKKKAKGEIKEYSIEWRAIYYTEVIADGRKFLSSDIPRHDSDLVECLEELGAFEASSLYSKLRIAKVDSDKYTIIKHEKHESVETPDTIGWVSVSD